jgi:hypothetical protein
MKTRILQNASICSNKPEPPTIRIIEGEDGWEAAYNSYIAGKNPTDSPEWKKGVYMLFAEFECDDIYVSKGIPHTGYKILL